MNLRETQPQRAKRTLGRLLGAGWLLGWLLLGGYLIQGAKLPSERTGKSAGSHQTSVVGRSGSAPARDGSARRTKNIEAIRAGDWVVARDEKSGRLSPKRVVRAFRRTSDHLRIVQIRSADGAQEQELRTTNEHPFWVAGRGWVEAGKLKVGQKLVQSDHQLGTVVDTRYKSFPTGTLVHNIKVEDYHSYYVSQSIINEPILVHNANYPGPQATPELARTIANVEKPPMNNLRTIAVLETREGPTLVAGGTSDLSAEQRTIAQQLGLTPVPDFPDIHAEGTVINGAGQLGLTPTRGVTTNNICEICEEMIIEMKGWLTGPRGFQF